MEFVLKIVFVLLLVGIAAIVAHFVDSARKKTSYDSMSFRETMDLCELPIVTFMNNGKKLIWYRWEKARCLIYQYVYKI